MRTRPEGVPDDDVVRVVVDGWGLVVEHVEHAPVGFGGYHWRASTDQGDWFVTLNDLVQRRRSQGETLDVPLHRLVVAMSAARSLGDAGLDFVVAPRRTRHGEVLHRFGDRFAVTVHPWVAGATHDFGPYERRAERLAVIDRLAVLHAVRPAQGAALVDDLSVPDRDRLVEALDDRGRRWDSGPFGEPARRLLDAHAGAVVEALARYDRLTAAVARRPERMVLTHGEPHRGNTIDTADGVVLVDWDTIRVAPPERDLWMVADGDRSVLDAYVERTGTEPDEDALVLFRLWWDLVNVATCTGDLHGPHLDDADTRIAWDSLELYLDPTRWR